jgi:hypothetical protein
MIIRGEPVERGSNVDFLLSALTRRPPEAVQCSECGKEVPYAYIAHHYIDPVHGAADGLAPDWVTRYVCRDCEGQP